MILVLFFIVILAIWFYFKKKKENKVLFYCPTCFYTWYDKLGLGCPKCKKLKK